MLIANNIIIQKKYAISKNNSAHSILIDSLILISSTIRTFFVRLPRFQFYGATPEMQFRRIGQLAHSAVRFAAVEGQFSLIPYSFYNTFGQLTDGDFLTGADVDMAVADIFAAFFIGIFEVYVLHYEDAGICHFFAPKELAEWSTCPPKSDFCFADSVFLQNSQDFFFRTVAIYTFYGRRFISLRTASQFPSFRQCAR